MRNLTAEDFAQRWPGAPAEIVKGIVDAQDAVYAKYKINTIGRVAMMWAQFSEETGEWTDSTESLNYSAKSLLKMFPRHFNAETANLYGRTPEHKANQIAIGNLAYGGRMGNRVAPDPTKADDGYNYRGRGLIQTTGKDGYATLAHLTGLPILENPDMVNQPEHVLVCGVAEYVNYPGMMAATDAGDILKVTKLINGGTNGLAERKAQWAAWKAHLGIE